MPELPEVENVRASLEPVLVGQTLARVQLYRANLRFPFPEDFSARLCGCVIRSITRRAKYLLLHLDRGEVLVVHLGMTGRFLVADTGRGASEPASRGGAIGTYVHDTRQAAVHDHVVFETVSGVRLTYNDPRRFGYMLLLPDAQLEHHDHFKQLGVEPLGNAFNAAGLSARAAGRRADLKAFLMDQRNVAGLGNIYVCEALFRSGLSPRRRAGSLADRWGRPVVRAERLVAAVREVLEDAISAGGSTLRDYRKPDGSSGDFQTAHAVYDRADEACIRPDCGGTIRRIVQAGRSTFYCPRCQK